jgi:hypothetical protein
MGQLASDALDHPNAAADHRRDLAQAAARSLPAQPTPTNELVAEVYDRMPLILMRRKAG